MLTDIQEFALTHATRAVIDVSLDLLAEPEEDTKREATRALLTEQGFANDLACHLEYIISALREELDYFAKIAAQPLEHADLREHIAAQVTAGFRNLAEPAKDYQPALDCLKRILAATAA